jgi:hypothetical protein
MSHMVTIQTQVKDRAAIAAACLRLGLAAPTDGTATLYAGQTAAGTLVQLPGWKYPLAIDTTTGAVRHDHFGGSWGEPAQLDRFLVAYAVEKCKLEARRQGKSCTEQALADGSVKLTIQEG